MKPAPEWEARKLSLSPIGVVHSPYKERIQAPRQPDAARGVTGRIELFPGRNFEHALLDLSSFRHVWVVFWFHLNPGWRPKVLPPRSSRRRGVFATRSPHRPNPIGLSAVELIAVERLTLHVANLDMLDGTPVLDLKPYVPYTDALPDAEHGWLDDSVDPVGDFLVSYSEGAELELAFLETRFGLELRPDIEAVLKLGPAPHPYRRIRREGDAFRLAFKQWRVRFSVAGREIRVLELASGYRPKELALSEDLELEPHRAFLREFGAGAR